MNKKYKALFFIMIFTTNLQSLTEKVFVTNANNENKALAETFDAKTRRSKLIYLLECYVHITKNTDEKIMCNYVFFINDLCATFSLPNFHTGYKLHSLNDFKILLADLKLIEQDIASYKLIFCDNSTLLKTAAIARMYIEKRIAQVVANIEENEQEIINKLIVLIDTCIPMGQIQPLEETKHYTSFINILYNDFSISGPSLADFNQIQQYIKQLKETYKTDSHLLEKINRADEYVTLYIKRIYDKFYGTFLKSMAKS